VPIDLATSFYFSCFIFIRWSLQASKETINYELYAATPAASLCSGSMADLGRQASIALQ